MKRKEKKNKSKKVKNPHVKALQERVNSLKKHIKSIEGRIFQHAGIQDRLTDRTMSLNEYQVAFKLGPEDSRVVRLKGEISVLNVGLSKIPIHDLRIQLEKSKEQLNEAERELEAENRILATERLIAEKKAELQRQAQKSNSNDIHRSKPPRANKIIRPNWDEITFMDGFIKIYHNHELYEFITSLSKSYLNKIKSYYSFKKVPLLEIVVSSGNVAIKNEELLFFNIKFLSLLGVEFGVVKYENSQLALWTKYNKAFYKRELPYLLHTDSLRKLCELCDNNLPIIPVGELVINFKGDRQIHHSFLFPLKCRNRVNVIWESEEESKASYIFRLTEPYLESVQLLYEFIAGQTINKRESLIHSKNLQIALGMKGRLFHNSFDGWLSELKSYL